MDVVYEAVAYYIKEYENMLIINDEKMCVVPRGQLSPIFYHLSPYT